MVRTRIHRLAGIAFAVLLVMSTAAPAPVAAQSSEEPFFNGLINDQSTVGALEWAATKSVSITSWIARQDVPFVGGDSEGTATEYATAFEDEFNQHNASIESYASARLDATSEYDTFAVYFHDKQGNNVTRYVVAETSNGTWQNARVLNQSEYDELMNRQTDHWVSLDWYQSKHAASELDTFVADHAHPEKNLTAGYRAKLLAKYGAPDSDMWSSNGSDA